MSSNTNETTNARSSGDVTTTSSTRPSQRNSHNSYQRNNRQNGDQSGNDGGNETTHRGNNRKKSNQPNGNVNNTKKDNKPKFKGATDEMNGHIFQCHSETSDRNQYNRTLEELNRYIRKEMAYANDLAYLLRNEEDPEIEDPDDLSDKPSAMEKFKWEKEMEAVLKRRERLEENKGAVYAVILGQCSLLMENELKSNDEFKRINVEQKECVKLLQVIKSIIYQYDSKQHLYSALLNSKANMYTIKQGGNESVIEYKERFDAMYKAVEYHGGGIGDDYALKTYELIKAGRDPKILQAEELSKDQVKLVKAASISATERMKVFIFLKGADEQHYHQLHTDLHNNYLQGIDQYPTSMTKALDLLQHYKRNSCKSNGKDSRDGSRDKNGQNKSSKRGGDGGNRNGGGNLDANDRSNAVHNGENGNTVTPRNTTAEMFLLADGVDDSAYYTPVPVDYSAMDNNDVMSVQHVLDKHIMLLQKGRQGGIPITWVLLDNESTVSIFCNAKLLINIWKIPPGARPLELHTNGGVQITNTVGDLPGFGTVWFNKDSLANVLSLAHVRRMVRVTYDSWVKPAFTVYRKDGRTTIEFIECRKGLHYYDTALHKPKDVTTEYLFLETVAQNKAQFTKRECDQAALAKKVHALTGRQAHQDIIKHLQSGALKNSPITHEDMQRAAYIYGPEVPSIKGGTVRKQPKHVPDFKPTPLPDSLMKYHHRVTICTDVVYIHKLPFLHSISRGIMFRTQQSLEDRHYWTILKGIKLIIELYEQKGFIVHSIYADNEFGGLQKDLPNIELNTCGADEHVPEIERSNRTLKERIRATTHSLPFRYHPKTLINGVVQHANAWLNAFPNKNAICKTLSPREVVTGRQTDFNIDCKVEIGTYCQITEHNEPTNNMDARTRDAIALHTTGNRQGTYFFMALDTWEKVARNQWRELPMPESIISLVNTRGRHEHRKPIKKINTFTYEWRPRKPMFADEDVDEDDDDPDYVPNEEPEETSDDESANTTDDDDQSTTSEQKSVDNEPLTMPPATTTTPTPTPLPTAVPIVTDPTTPANKTNTTAEQEPPPDFNPDDQFVGGGYNLHRSKQPSYQHLFNEDDHAFLQVAAEPTPERQHAAVTSILNFLFTQAATELPSHTEDMPYKKGIEMFGEQAVQAIIKEVAQLDEKDVCHAIDANTLTHLQRKAALRALTFVKQKRCGRIKARTCADGRGQQKYYNKSESASPTVSIEGLLISLAIDAIEHRDVATADVTGAYLNADMDDFVLLKFDGKMVDFVIANNPEYEKFVAIENGKRVIYMKLDKALYGCLRSAILWYDMFSGFLKECGFELNPYDLCVANKTIEGKQCTICWYVDDLKVSHVDPKVVTRVIKMIERKFGEMNVVRGKKHTYVGCDIEFLENGEVSIDNIEYLKECIQDFGEDVSTHVTTPASKNLLTPKPGSPALDKEKSEKYHSIVMKLLWVSKRSRPDLETTLSYLCTRTHKSTDDDWMKLKRLLQFVNKTINDKRILSASSLGRISMWIDASYAVHEDMKSHTGAAISLGKGTVYCSSSKQKLNVKSSTEGELVGCSDKVPQGIWSKHFIEAQGYDIKEFNLGQDNTSAMLLEQNGQMSAGQKSRHINIRYFFIKDRLKQDKITLVHCPTEIMIADYFTKPLQGQLFQKMRDVIMGYCNIDELVMSGSKERVESEIVKSDTTVIESNKIAEDTNDGSTRSWSDVVRGTKEKKALKMQRKTGKQVVRDISLF